ncbi:MAG: SLC13 family permease [Ignisphaera sp.]
MLKRMLVVFLALFIISFLIMNYLRIDNDTIGLKIIEMWLNERTNGSASVSTPPDVNSIQLVLEQALSLALFLSVIVATIIKIEWRVSVAILSISIIIFLGIVPPYNLIHKSIEWNLIIFLIGSMTLAGLLREFGIFRYLAVNIVRISKDNPYVLIAMISILSFITAAILDEVTSIVYVTVLVIELYSILKIDVIPLLITAVLATNTGSSALPVGNPIGIYLLFSTNMNLSTYIRYSLPAALLNIMALLLTVFLIHRNYINKLKGVLKERRTHLQAYVTHYYTSFNGIKRNYLDYGLLMFVLFIVAITLNEHIAHIISKITQQNIDPHSLLAFTPYIFIALCLTKIYPEELPKYIERSVEWSSLLFFICLFILSYSLQYTGVMAKLVYALTKLTTSTATLLPLLLLSTATLSAVLDNLSIIVAFTPITILLNSLGLAPFTVYFALLYGGVFGGNYTPIGSTANIVAISMAEKRKIKIGWKVWLEVAFLSTTVQILIALIWLYSTSL